ncbi:MAG TPA: tetratricopeptide repeat protein [Pyrinomonadaceae bacterium]|nr:tetratricopeptide repeat protein [Pyrinomonadaceae bacterium]
MKKIVLAVVFSSLFGIFSVSAQETGSPIAPPRPAVSPAPRLSDVFKQNLDKQTTEVSRENREQAYAKLLEAQRYIWNINNLRAQYGSPAGGQSARQALLKAIELNPRLAEAYTALAELTLRFSPREAQEAVEFAKIAVRLDPNNFGGRRILARVYTLQSRLNLETLNQEFAQAAISEWKEIARLDPRSAEAWAFLSVFYEKTGREEERINALNRWLAAAAPLETNFYRTVMGRDENLSPEAATVKLGAALIEVGRAQEAVEILSRAISEEPDNIMAVELLREAIGSSDEKTAGLASEALQQAIYSNPENTSLILLLAQTQARSGNLENGAKTLREAISKLEATDKNAAAELQFELAEIYAQADRHDEAIAVLQNALRIRGIGATELVTDVDREFAFLVYDKMIKIYKSAGRLNEAKLIVEKIRPLFGKDDLFADRQLIEILHESGNRQEALQALRAARARFPADFSLLRMEATLLTELGRVDEAVKLIQPLLENKPAATPSPANESFTNYLFISGLYSQARRGKEAVQAANQAFTVAQGEEQKQIAKLTLATAQQMSGDFTGAEKTLRDILAKTPGNPIALNNLGYFLLERDVKIQEAFDLIQKAVNVDPTNPSYLDSLGWAYYKLGKYAEAEKYLKSAARYDSGSSTIMEHLGDAYQKQGKLELAKTAWQKALSLAANAEDINRLKTKLK